MTATTKSPKRKPFNFGEQLRSARSKMEHRFAAAIGEEDKSFNPEALLDSIRDQLIAERRGMVMKLLGFSTRWGELELDTSARGQGMLRSFVEDAVAKATQRWVDENPTFFEEAVQDAFKNPKLKTTLRKHFAEQFEWRMRQAAEEAACRLAREEAEAFYNEAKSQLSMAAERD